MAGNPLSQKLVPQTLARIGVITRQPLLWVSLLWLWRPRVGREGSKQHCVGPFATCWGLQPATCRNLYSDGLSPATLDLESPKLSEESFPSGHNAAEVAYVFGASLEASIVFLPLGTMALLGHLSQVKAGKHYVSDTIVGGFIGLAVALLTAKAWAPQTGHRVGSSISNTKQ